MKYYLLAALLALLRIPPALAALLPGYDLRAYIAAARAARLGLPFVGLTNAALMSGPVPAYVYPPPLALLLVPIGMLDDDTALLAVRLLALLGTIVLIIVARRSVGTMPALFGVLCLPATWMSLYQGQINALIAGLMLLALLPSRSAGVWLALATLLKVTPALLVTRRTCVPFLLTCTGVFVLTLPIVGVREWIAFLFPPATCDPSLIALRGALCRIPSLLPLLPVLMVAVLLLSLRSPAALILAPLLVGPLVWSQSMVLALPALALLWQQQRRGAVLLWFAFAALPGPALIIPLAAGWGLSVCMDRNAS